VVRLSGPRAVAIAGGRPGAVVFRAPHSYTREDVVEIHLPGSPSLVDLLVRDLVEAGARPARPGEFTLRAFLNGRLGLAEAEAVERLIAAEDEEDRRAALDQMEGAFTRRLQGIREAVLDLAADVEASLDFADQDVGGLEPGEARRRAAAALAELRALLRETAASRVCDERPTVVLLGRPGAGKSSLFNALTGSEALVTGRAGTTRDLLEAELDAGGMKVRLYDAAGIGEGTGVDAEAARRAGEAARRADVVLFVVDAADWEASVPLEPRGRPAVLVLSKCDRVPGRDVGDRFRLRPAVYTSARTGEGLEELRRVLGEVLRTGEGGGAGARFRVDFRRRALLREAEAALERAEGAMDLGWEFLSLDLRAALDALGDLAGRDVGEDVLDRIFSRFCLGK